ncbi:MAG: substrate-binding domain-containing protein [Chloroflexi bacterium]|nr:substrate-binding domain-containing protein [Chloroflexota bacterium]
MITFLAACNAQGSASDEALLEIALSPAAQSVQAALAACGASQTARLHVEQRVPGQTNPEDYDVIIQLGPPQDTDFFAAPLAEEQILIAVNPLNPADSLNRIDLAEIFRGQIDQWAALDGPDDAISVWVGPEGDEARRALQTDFLQGSPVTGNAHIAATPQLMLDAIASDPNAIGVLPAAWADASVKTIDVGLRVPLLALSASEPQGPARTLINCLQSEVGQAILSQSYPTLP